jgi:hypothetical protein
VQMDGDGRYAKPIEDPAVTYARRYGRPRVATEPTADTATSAPAPMEREVDVPSSDDQADCVAARGPIASQEPSCPKCGGRMWDNRLTKRNPKAPDYKCRDRSCDGVIWPPKPGAKPEKSEPAKVPSEETEEIPF